MTEYVHCGFAVAGGLIAQAAEPTVGYAGLVIAVTGLVGGLLNYYKAYLDSRVAIRKLEIQEDRVAELERRLAEASKRGRETADQVVVNTERFQSLIPATQAIADGAGVPVRVPEPPPTILLPANPPGPA